MDLLLIIISLATLAQLIAYLYQPLQAIKDWFKLYKYFPYVYCSKCVAFNLGLLLFWHLDYNWIYIILYSSMASILAYTLNQFLIQVDNEEM